MLKDIAGIKGRKRNVKGKKSIKIIIVRLLNIK